MRTKYEIDKNKAETLEAKNEKKKKTKEKRTQMISFSFVIYKINRQTLISAWA